MGLLRVSGLVLLTAIALKFAPDFFASPPPLKFQGSVEQGWEVVAERFKGLLEKHRHYGYAYSVYYQGKKVVDLYGGYANGAPDVLEPWRENTLAQIYSSTKGISALCVAMLVERGLLDYKQKVSHYWPEFAANGKESITVETLLSHQAGLYTIAEGWSGFDLWENPEKISRQLAEQKPAWKPGSDRGYHPLTHALYMNELVKRVDPQQRPLWEFFDQELAKPLGLDAYIGLPYSEYYRTAMVSSSGAGDPSDLYSLLFEGGWKLIKVALTPGSLLAKALTDLKEPSWFAGNSPHLRRMPCGSYAGHGTARDLAKLMNVMVTDGTYEGQHILSPNTTRMLTEVLTEGFDLVLNLPVKYGRGTTLFESPLGSMLLGAPGAGGQMVYGDLDHQVAIAFQTNKMWAGFRGLMSTPFEQLFSATYDIIKQNK